MTAEQGGEKQEGSICSLFGIMSEAEPAEGWHHVPYPKVARVECAKAKSADGKVPFHASPHATQREVLFYV